MKDNDVELIHRVLEGDDSAFSTLVEKYQKQVHALAWRKIGDFHIAEDITQDTFLNAYQNLTTLKNPQRFSGWLYVIATRCCQAWLRKKQIQTESLEEMDSDTLEPEAYSRYVSEQETKVSVAAQRQVVKKLLATLPESERTVMTLHYFGEMTCESMSEFLGVSANTIKSRLRRARQRLKQEEPMIREAITNFKISPTLTEDIMKEISQLKPSTPSASKPIIPWVIGATSALLIALIFGIGGQYLANFQKPYSFDAQAERTVELVDVQIVQNLEVEPANRNQVGNRADLGGRNDGNEENANQVVDKNEDYTRWNLPKGAKRRLGKGVLSDMKVSPDGSRIAIATSAGIWLYNVNAKQEMDRSEIALLTGHGGVVKQLTFSPNSKMFASIGVDKTIRLWETMTGRHLFTLTTPKPTGEFRSVKFIRDGRTLAGRCSDDYKVYLWDVTTGDFVESYSPKLPIVRLGQDRDWRFATDTFFDPIGNITFAVGTKDGTISIREGRTGREKIRLVGYTDETEFFKVDNEHDPQNPRKPTVRRSTTKQGDKPSIRIQLKADGTPFPIQYLLSAPNHSRHNYEKQPTKWINTLDFSSDGKTLVSRSKYKLTQDDGYTLFSGGPIEIWDVETGEQLTSLPMRVSEVIFSDNGKTLAIIGNGGVSVWDVASRQEIGVFNDAKKAVFSGDGKTLCIIEHAPNTMSYVLWEIATRQDIATRRENRSLGDDLVNPLNLEIPPIENVPDRFELNYDGSLLTIMNNSGKVSVWETTKTTKLRTLSRGYTDTFTSLTFTHDGKTLVSGNSAGGIDFWDINTGKTPRRMESDDSIAWLMFSEDNTILTVLSDKRLTRWDMTTKMPVYANKILNSSIWTSSASLSDGTQMRVKALSFSSNGKKLVTKNKETNMVDVWDISIGKEPNHLTEIEHQWGPVTLSPDGDTLAHASKSDNGVDLWDANSGKLLTKLNIPKQLLTRNNYISSIAFSHDGRILSGGTNKNDIHLWDSANYEHIGILKAHKYVVCALEFSPDNTILASGDTGSGVCLWSISDRKLLATYSSFGEGYVSELEFSPDGKTLASTSGSSNFPKTPGGTIYLWDVPTK